MFTIICSDDGFRKYHYDKTKTFDGAINLFFENEIRIWDADNCGTDEFSMSIFDGETTRYYNCLYSWWIEYNPEWELCDEFECVEVSKDDINHHLVGNRDWLVP